MKCERCGQDLEPVWVGPGDTIKDRKTGYTFTVIGPDCRERVPVRADCIVERGPGEFMRFWSSNNDCTTLDGRPVAGFRDPRDERIKELERKLEAAKITDEDIECMFSEWWNSTNRSFLDGARVIRDRIAKRVEETT